jgi:hypothetical protein
MGLSVVHVDEIEGSGPGGSVKFVRRVLGARGGSYEVRRPF